MPGKRPAYHRRKDLEWLRLAANDLPLVIDDAGHAYNVATEDGRVLLQGRYEVIHAFLRGWREGAAVGGTSG